MSERRAFSTIRTLMNRNAMLYPDKPALKEVEGSRVLTYQGMKERAETGWGNALRGLGAKKRGSRRHTQSRNSFEYMESAINYTETPG